jgi:hypothetical protein
MDNESLLAQAPLTKKGLVQVLIAALNAARNLAIRREVAFAHLALRPRPAR